MSIKLHQNKNVMESTEFKTWQKENNPQNFSKNLGKNSDSCDSNQWCKRIHLPNNSQISAKKSLDFFILVNEFTCHEI